MKPFALFLISFLSITSLFSQRYDFIWMNGYDGGKGDIRFGTSMMDFKEGNPVASFIPEGKLNIFTCNASIADKKGNLMYYTNGYDVMDAQHKLVKGATDLGIRYWDGLKAHQGALFLSDLGDESKYHLLHVDLNYSSVNGLVTWHVFKINWLTIDSKLNQVIKNKIILEDTINDSFISACKHANGRDWWLILNKYKTNTFYKFLFSPAGIELTDVQNIGPIVRDGASHALFSPKGNYFAILEGISNREGMFIYLYTFDRCNGKLGFIDVANYGAKGFMGISFSPNEKYLYWSEGYNLYQMDLTSPDPVNYSVKVDSIVDVTPPWGSSYGHHQAGPDGRIYIVNGHNNFVMHVIDRPNEYKKACKPWQNGFRLHTLTNLGIPYFPNYRLGPIDGSVCDTLGIDNVPWVWWRYDQDTSRYRCFEFVDLSGYLTEESVPEWYWDLGDGTQSRDTSPIHCYEKDGIYEVCLIIKNKYGADTLCRTLNVGTSATIEEGKMVIKTDIFPNPASDHFVLNVHDYLPERMFLHLINPQGQTVYRERIYQGSNVIDTEKLPTGIYLVNIFERGLLVKSEKIVLGD